MNVRSLLIFLLIVHFIKEIVWLAVIPIWHFPDEEQHFGQTAFLAEKGRNPRGTDFDINREIDISSEILGTKRNNLGINKFTYHPEYRIPYSNSELGIFEQTLKNINTQDNRQTMVKQESARYGFFYYFLTAIPYKIFFQSDLLVRVFTSRFISVILSVLMVLTVYLTAREIFKDELLRLTLTFLVAFQPMYSFVSAGVNSDNLFNLIFSVILYSSLKIFFSTRNNFSWKNCFFTWCLLIISFILGLYTKKQIFISLPIILFGFLLSFLIKNRKIKKIGIVSLALVIAIFLIVTKGKIRIPEYAPSSQIIFNENFYQYIYWHLRHTVAETIPWYWGVFNWLGVTLPRRVLRVQARLLIIAVLGLLIYLIKEIKKKKLLNINNIKIFFLFGSSFIYYFSIITWDYFFRQGHSFSFGIQGRYFFPTIISHMLIILLGLISIFPTKFKQIVVKILIAWWFIFSLIGLFTAAGAYYQLWPITTFLNQASQYKPVIFKAAGLSFIFLLFFISSLILIIRMLYFYERKNS